MRMHPVREPPIGVQRAPLANETERFPHATDAQSFNFRIRRVNGITEVPFRVTGAIKELQLCAMYDVKKNPQVTPR